MPGLSAKLSATIPEVLLQVEVPETMLEVPLEVPRTVPDVLLEVPLEFLETKVVSRAPTSQNGMYDLRLV